MDEYQGVGGSYINDAKTGKRKPFVAKEEPVAPTPAPNTEVLTDGTDSQASDSNKN